MTESKIELNRRDFIALLKRGGVFCGKNKALPILEDVKCVTKGNRIRIESTDGDNVVRCYGDLLSVSGEDTRFCAGVKDLTNILTIIDDETVTIVVDADERKEITVCHSRGKSVFPYMPVDDFPVYPAVKDGNIHLSLPAGLLARWLSVASNFTAIVTLRPVMNGIFLFSENGKLGVAASDGHKLFYSERETVAGCPDFRAIINRAAAMALLNGFNDGNDTVELTVDANTVVFSTPFMKITSRLIDGKYPNIWSVIPKEDPYTLNFSRKDMIGAIRRLLPQAGTDVGLIRFETDAISVKATAEDLDFHKSGEEFIPFTGDNIAPFGLKGTTFLQILSLFGDDEVVMRKSTPERAVTVVRTNDDGCKDTFLLMPMMIK